MTPNEFKEKMEKIYSVGYDPENAHIRADDVICDLLRKLGYGEGADLFEDAERWYA